MRSKKELSKNEAKVLYGLVRYPESPAAHIAKSLGIPQPTFSNIQRRLKRAGLFQAMGTPDVRALGLDTFAVLYGKLNPTYLNVERARLERETRQQHPEIFFMVSGVNDIIIFMASNDFSELSKAIESVERAYLVKGAISKEGFKKLNIALSTTLVVRWFDYSNALFTKFALQGTGVPPPEGISMEQPVKVPLAELSPNEAHVLLYLLESPDATDVKISKRLGLSRNTVAKAKARLVSQRLFRRLVAPNLQDLGFEVFAFTNTEFASETDYQQRLSSTKWLVEALPIVFSMVTNRNALTMYAFVTYLSMQEMKRVALQEYVGKGYIKQDVETIIYSTAEIRDQLGPNFIPLLRKVLQSGAVTGAKRPV